MADLELMQALATNHEALSVSHSVGSNGTDVLTFKLPSSVQEIEQTIMENVFCAEDETFLRPGIDRRVALALVQRQVVIDICLCGNVWGVHSRVERETSSGQPAKTRQSDADIAPQAPRLPPGRAASESACSARDAQFIGHCHRTSWQVSSRYRDRSLSPFTGRQLLLHWPGLNTVK